MYTIDNKLSETVIQKYLDLSNQLNESDLLDDGFQKRYLKVYEDNELADEVTSICSDILKPVERQDERKFVMAFDKYCLCDKFTFEPLECHPTVIMSKYHSDGILNEHQDRITSYNLDERSIYSVVIYLTDGSSTVFGKNEVEGKRNRIIVFDHDIVHRSGPMTEEYKIILRLDYMFKRQVPMFSKRDNDNFHLVKSILMRALYKDLQLFDYLISRCKRNNKLMYHWVASIGMNRIKMIQTCSDIKDLAKDVPIHVYCP